MSQYIVPIIAKHQEVLFKDMKGERARWDVFIHRLYDFILGRKSSIKPPLSNMPPPSVISPLFQGKKVYKPPPLPPLPSPKYSSLINDVLSSRNNNNANFICVFECTIVNLATYRQFTNAAWDWIIKKKKQTKNKNKKNKSKNKTKNKNKNKNKTKAKKKKKSKLH